MEPYGAEGCVFVEVVRLLMVVLGTVVGFGLGGDVSDASGLVGAVIGAGACYVGGGLAVTVAGYTASGGEWRARPQSASDRLMSVLTGGVAVLIGLVGAAGLSVLMPRPWMTPLGAIIVWLAAGLGARAGRRYSAELLALVGLAPLGDGRVPAGFGVSGVSTLVVDSTAVVDGRLLPIVRSGFVTGDLLLPRFVCDELERVVKAGDPIERRRAKGGLDLLDLLEKESSVTVRIIDDHLPGVHAPAARLLATCHSLGVGLITADPRIAHLADCQDVRCVNLLRLAEVLDLGPDELDRVSVVLVRRGTESGQAVGYLDNGTMVVVNEARDRIGQRVVVRLGTQVSTSRGQLVFGELDEPIWSDACDDESIER